MDLQPGWNLVSLPVGEVSEVLKDTEACVILSYQNGDWLASVCAEDGWHGRLTRTDFGLGYWVFKGVYGESELPPTPEWRYVRETSNW